MLAIFAPLGSLVRVLDVILTWADEIDSLLNDPDLSPDFHTDEGRRTLEGQVAYGEHWVNILTAARTAELLGLRRTARFDTAWSFWRPHTPRSAPHRAVVLLSGAHRRPVGLLSLAGGAARCRATLSAPRS